MIKFTFSRLLNSMIYLMSKSASYILPFTIINFFFLLLICLMLLGFGFSIKLLVGDNVDALKNSFLFLGFAGVLLTFTYNLRRHVSEDYFKEAKEQIAKAYDIIFCENPVDLTKDRLKWLTTARMLRTSERLSKKIMMESHKELYSEEKQYYRIKFSELIGDFPDGFFDDSLEYFKDPFNSKKSSIVDDSLIVVSRFMAWDKNYEDPLDHFSVAELSAAEKHRMRVIGPKNLHRYLEAKIGIAEEIKRKKKERIRNFK
ncbi:hypothetical protein [Serratia fonticola]